MREQLGAWLASYPQTISAAPFVSLIAAGLLISGFGTRIVAVALALAVPLSGATMQLDERLYWALALGILILRGPGLFSLDKLVEEAFRRAARREAPKENPCRMWWLSGAALAASLRPVDSPVRHAE